MLLGNTASRNSLPICLHRWRHAVVTLSVQCRWCYVSSQCWTESTLHVNVNNLRLSSCSAVAFRGLFFSVLFLWWPFVCLILSPNKPISCQSTANFISTVQDGVWCKQAKSVSINIVYIDAWIVAVFHAFFFSILHSNHVYSCLSTQTPTSNLLFSFWLWTRMA